MMLLMPIFSRRYSLVENFHEIFMIFSSCLSSFTFCLSDVSSFFTSREVILLLRDLMSLWMSLAVFSRIDCVRYDEVEGKIASVAMKDVGPDSVFVAVDIVRNKDWLGLLDYLQIIDL